MIWTVSFAASSLISAHNTFAPSRANRTAVAFPLPKPARPIRLRPPGLFCLASVRPSSFSRFCRLFMSAVGPEALIPFWHPSLKRVTRPQCQWRKSDYEREPTPKDGTNPDCSATGGPPLSCENLKHAGMICSGFLDSDSEIRRIEDDGVN